MVLKKVGNHYSTGLLYSALVAGSKRHVGKLNIGYENMSKNQE